MSPILQSYLYLSSYCFAFCFSFQIPHFCYCHKFHIPLSVPQPNSFTNEAITLQLRGESFSALTIFPYNLRGLTSVAKTLRAKIALSTRELHTPVLFHTLIKLTDVATTNNEFSRVPSQKLTHIENLSHKHTHSPSYLGK